MGYRCAVCGGSFAEDKLGFVCEHFAQRPGITYCAADQDVAVPDTACTGCEARREGDPQTTIRLEAACVDCYQQMCAVRIPATPEDTARGWALGGPAHYAALGNRPAVPVPAVEVGGHAKLMFSKIPAPERRDLEHMWIAVTERDGARIAGTLDNDPTVITTLTDGARIETTIDHVVDAMFGDELVALVGDHSCPRCVETGTPRRPLDDSDRKLLSDVRTWGWHYLMVHGDDEGPGWGFTVGLEHSFGHPELFVPELPPETTKQVITRLGNRVRAGERFEPGRAYSGLLEGVACHFEPYTDAKAIHEHLGYARWFYRGNDFRVLRLGYR